MGHMKTLLVSLFALAILTVAPAQTSEKPPSVKEVRAALQIMLKTPSKAKDTDMSMVVRFAELSDACLVEVTPKLIANMTETREFRLLLSYYLAGAVQYDLDNPKKMRDRLADKEAAVKAQLMIYREIQKQKKGFKDSVLDNLTKLEKEGKLAAHIKKVMAEAAKQK